MRIAAGEAPPTARQSPARLFTSMIGISGPALAGPVTVASSRDSASISRRIGFSSLGFRSSLDLGWHARDGPPQAAGEAGGREGPIDLGTRFREVLPALEVHGQDGGGAERPRGLDAFLGGEREVLWSYRGHARGAYEQ